MYIKCGENVDENITQKLQKKYNNNNNNHPFNMM